MPGFRTGCVDRTLGTSNALHPWGWHDRYVGRWVIDIQLNPEQYRVFGHGCLLDIVADALETTGDFFVPAQIKCLARHKLSDQPAPRGPVLVREVLDRMWSTLALDEDYRPACDIYGISHIYVRNADGVTKALVPHALGLRLECLPGKKPVARMTVYTRCDAWLERTVDGYDNALVGSANGPLLTDNLIALETRLAGTISQIHTDFDLVKIDKYGLKNK